MKTHRFLVFMASTLLLIVMLFGAKHFTVTSSSSQELASQATTLITPSGDDVCTIVTSMPGAENTDELLSLLKTNRQDLLNDLKAMKANMERYDAEGYGWQNVIDGSSSLEPRPSSWLIGVLRMVCDHYL